MHQLLVSIIIPTHNRAHLIGETLESVLSQTYQNWECLVVDDRSTDFTKELLGFYCNKDNRIKYINRPENVLKGANTCRNIGFEISQGGFIQWLDSDDIISCNKITAQVNLLEKTKANLSTCQWGRFSNNNSPLFFQDLESYKDFEHPLDFLEALPASHGYFPIHAYLMKRDLVIKSGPWLEKLTVNQDCEFIVRIILNSKKICFAKNASVFYRYQDNLNTSNYDEAKIQDLINSWILIEKYLYLKYKQKEFYYIEDAKERIYFVCRQWPELISKNKRFFKVSIRKNAFSYRLFKKIKRSLQIFSKHFN